MSVVGEIVGVILAVFFWLIVIIIGLAMLFLTVMFIWAGVSGLRLLKQGFVSITIIPRSLSTRHPLLHSNASADNLWQLLFYRALGEVYFDILLGLFGFIIAIFSIVLTEQSSPPAWVTLCLMCIVIIRGKVVDAVFAIDAGLSDSDSVMQTIWRMLQDDFFKWIQIPSFAFLAGCLDVIDGLAHGIALGSAVFLSKRAQSQFSVGWSSGPVALVGKVMVFMHLSGLMALVMLIAAIWQLGAVCIDDSKDEGANQGGVYYCGRLVGLGGLTRLMEVKNLVGPHQQTFIPAQVAITKALGETCPWTFLQTSLLMMSFSATDVIILTISAVVSFKQLACIYKVYKTYKDNGEAENALNVFILFSLFILLCGLNMARIAGAAVCRGEFGLFTGCA